MTRAISLSSPLRVIGATALVAAGLLLFSAEDAGAARERGTAGTEERELWCSGQLASCMNNGFKDCETRYASASAREELLCQEGVATACNNSFGPPPGNCTTLPRSTPGRPIPTGPRVRPRL